MASSIYVLGNWVKIHFCHYSYSGAWRLGFSSIRVKLYLYSLPPDQLWAFFEDYLLDEEEIDPKAGGGDPMTIGQMVKLYF